MSRGNPPTLRRALLVPATAVAVLVTAAGCGAAPAPIAVSNGTPADGMVAAPVPTGPTGSLTGSLTGSDAGTGSTAGSAAQGDAGTDEVHRTPSPGGAEPAARRAQPTLACSTIVFDPATNDRASQITAYRLTCGQALAVVRRVSTAHAVDDHPTTFTLAGYRCTAKVFTDGVPAADYDCSQAGGQRVRWHKT